MSSPISAGSDARIPFVSIRSGDGDTSVLSWPGSTAVTYKMLSNTDLGATWPSYAEDLMGASVSFPITEPKRFFVMEFDDNTPPMWNSDPFTALSASLDEAYFANISSMASDPDVGDDLTFSKVDGPAWLSVSEAGDLSGTPTVVSADYFTVKVSDDRGATSIAKLQVSVSSSHTDTFIATDDTYGKENEPTLVHGGGKTIDLRQEGGSNYERVGYLKFQVTGVGTIQSARLFLHSDTEADSVNALAVSDTSWTEVALNWDNRPPIGRVIGNATATPGDWFSIDISSYITADGTYSIALDEQGNSIGKLDSKEGGFAPYLEIIWN